MIAPLTPSDRYVDFHGLELRMLATGKVASITLFNAQKWFAYRHERWPGQIPSDIVHFLNGRCADDFAQLVAGAEGSR